MVVSKLTLLCRLQYNTDVTAHRISVRWVLGWTTRMVRRRIPTQVINDYSSPEFRLQTRGRNTVNNTLKRNFPTLMFHQKNRCFYMQIRKLWLLYYHTNCSMFDQILQQDWRLIGKIAYTVHKFCHGEMQLLPHARRIIQHRDRTRSGNSSFPFHIVFCIGSCIFSFRAHISSWSRTRDTILIHGLNHGWNRTIVTPLNESVIILLTFTLCCSLHIVLGIELRHQFGNILLLNVASFLYLLCAWGHQLPIPKQ